MKRCLDTGGAVLLAALWIGACGSDDAPADGEPGAGDGGAIVDGGGTTIDVDAALPEPGPPITITGHVNGGLFTMERDPVSVCVYEPEGFGCVETDDLGFYAIEVPSEAQVALRFEGAGLIPTLRVIVTLEEGVDLGNTRVVSVGGLDGIAGMLGVELDPDKGVVFFGGVELVTAELVPPAGERYFVDYAGRVLEGAGFLEMYGSGGFLNVEPGRAAIRFSGPHFPCAFNRTNTLSGWPDPSDHTLAVVPVLPGHNVSMITMDCGTL